MRQRTPPQEQFKRGNAPARGTAFSGADAIDLAVGPGAAVTGQACGRKPTGCFEKWLGNSGQSDAWISCLTAAKLPRIRSEYDEANAPDA